MEEAKRGPGRPRLPGNQEIDGPEGKITRSNRRPFGSLQQRLAYPLRPGYHPHWFDDSQPGRVAHAQECGWEHRLDRDGKKVTRLGGTTANGQPQVLYLMDLPQEWYDDDMRVYQEEVNAREAAIKRGDLERKDGDGRYIPAQGISIKN